MFTRQAVIVIGLTARNIFKKICHANNNEHVVDISNLQPVSSRLISQDSIEDVADGLEKENRRYRIVNYTKMCRSFMDEHKIPGLQLAVSVDGKVVWNEAFGYYDLENQYKCHCYTTMRIDQISMPLTALMALKLDSTKLNDSWKDKVSNFVNQEKIQHATDTLKSLLDNNAGIVDQLEEDFWLNFKDKDYKAEINNNLGVTPAFEQPNFQKSIVGYLIAGACLERQFNDTSYETLFKRVFGPMKLCGTEVEKGVITFATRYYQEYKTEDGLSIKIQPYINSSISLPAAGIVSCARDLVKICNKMLYSSQFSDIDINYPYFNCFETMNMFRDLIHLGDMKSHSRGWDITMIMPNEQQKEKYLMKLTAEGKGPGASSAVVIHKPTNTWPFPGVDSESYAKTTCGEESTNQNKTRGVVVSVLMNLSNCPALELAERIAAGFYRERCID